MRYAVIIPVYNERDLFPRLVERLVAAPLPETADGPIERRIIIVDDASTDGTRTIVEQFRGRPDFEIILQDKNRGKGAAVRAGFARALEAGSDILLIQDADLEYDPRDHERLLEPIMDGRADAVFGSRFLGETHRVLYYWHSVANRFITLCSNMVTNLNLTDIECCLKAFARPVAARITIQEDRFGVEPELIAKVARLRLASRGGARAAPRVFEVGVSYAGRTYEEGKKITWRDGVWALWCIMKYGLLPAPAENRNPPP